MNEISGIGDPVEGEGDRRDIFVKQQIHLNHVLDHLSAVQVILNNTSIDQLAHNHLRATQAIVLKFMKQLQAIEQSAITQSSGCEF